MPHSRRLLRWLRFPSSGATRRRTMCRSTFSSAAFATPICIPRAVNGAARRILACPATRSSDAWREVGSGVKNFKEGDLAAVGCMVDSVSHVRELPGRPRAVLRRSPPPLLTTARTNTPAASPTADIRRASSSIRHFVLRVSDKLDLGGGRSALVRRHHDLLAAAALEGRPRAQGGRGRTRRSRPHGGKIRQCLRRACRPLHDFTGQDSRTRTSLGAHEVVISKNEDEMTEAREQL